MITLYHNPRCSKSRQALQLLTELSVEFTIIEYLKTPLNYDELLILSEQLNEPVETMVRSNETVFSELSLKDTDDATLLKAIAEHPILLQRPIVVKNDQAIIARPPEKVISFLKGTNS